MNSIETAVYLREFNPRWYQVPLLDALENKGYKQILCILPRRAGKDITAWNAMIRQAIQHVGVYYYIFPTYNQGRKVIWDSITNDGKRFLDYIPPEVIDGKPNASEMKIRLVNGSLIQVIGSDNIDRIMGTNPRGCVFSEYAIQDPKAYAFLRPILVANNGWSIFISTVRGKNHLYHLYHMAKDLPEWFVQLLTVDDTQHIAPEEIERERQQGIMSEDLIQQEYYNSWELGVQGAYYAKYIDRMHLEGRISPVPHQDGLQTHTAWDLGVHDTTCIIFFQCVGTNIHIIDCYENNKHGLEHYVQIINEKPYTYGNHFAPPDIAVVEWGSGVSRIEKALDLGLKFAYRTKNNKRMSVIPQMPITDGIETVRSLFSRLWIDSIRCQPLIAALENYRQEYDGQLQRYKPRPLHDWSSHYADAMRYLALALPKINRRNSTPEELERRYYEARYGKGNFFGTPFN